MKKILFTTLFAWLLVFSVQAQSTMSDKQILDFVMKEQKAGTSQAQIVTKLMQKGVNIQQIRRVRDKYERQAKDKGLGLVNDESTGKSTNRLRTQKTEEQYSSMSGTNQRRRFKVRRNKSTRVGYDENATMMEDELNGFLPDSATIKKKQWEKSYLEGMEKDRSKVFGRDIFYNEELSFEPNMNIATPANYNLGPGDVVFVDVYGASQRTFEETISPDGNIVLEDFGPIKVMGLTVEQANRKVRQKLGSRYAGSKIELTVGETRNIMVNVMGEVRVPGTYTLSAFASVFHALYMAGGMTNIGTLRNIKVYRNNRLISVVDLYDYILNGKLTGNVRLADNDVIVVGAYDCIVNISGKVKRPMYYEMKKNESLATLIKYAGGFTGDAYKKSVRLLRKSGIEQSIHTIGEFDFSNFKLDDGDSVAVDSVLQRYSNSVEVRGAVFRPGLYEVGKTINSVRTLLQQCEGVTEEAFTTRAVMHRMRPNHTLEVIPVDIEGILKGTVPDIPLQKNDILFVPTRTEMMQEQTITIHGEVNYPGVYRYAENETLEDFVLQAGGLKETASTVKVDVARRISNPKATTTDSLIAHIFSFELKDGFVVNGEKAFTLQPFDEVYVRKSPAYSSQQNIQITGQVMFAGTYTLATKNERLSDAIRRAGGLKDMAYAQGARLERRITPDERLRMQTTLAKVNRQNDREEKLNQNSLDLGDTYYVGIELDKALADPGGDADVVLREGDKIIVPEYNGTVKISGDVMFPNTVSYEKGKPVSWYINQAGGWGNRAKKSRTFVVYMNGTVQRVGHNTKIRPGCEIVVPSKPDSDKMKITDWISIGTSLTTMATMIATLANILR